MNRGPIKACPLTEQGQKERERLPIDSHESRIAALERTCNDMSRWVSRLMETTEEGVLLFSMDWELLEMNPAAGSLTGYEDAALCNKSAAPLFGGEAGFRKFCQLLEKSLGTEEALSFGVHMYRANGEVFPADCRVSRVSRAGTGDQAGDAEAGETLGVICVFSDMSERVRTARAVRESEARFRVIFNSVYDAIFIHELDGTIIDVNDSMLNMYGVRREEAVRFSLFSDYSSQENPLDDLPHYWSEVVAGRHQLFEWIARRPTDGGLFNVEVFLARIPFGSRDVILASVRDISERKQMEERLKEMAETDHLTGVANRRRFLEQAEKEFARAKRYGHPFSVLMIDVDHFKRVNDTYGHHTGDAVLQSVAMVCRAELRESDLFGRVGGEEFAAVLPESSSDFNPEPVREVAERLRKALADIPIADGEARISVTISIGVSSFRMGDVRFADVLRRADAALYRAKNTGRNKVVVD